MVATYWQASQVGSVIAQTLPATASSDTAFSFPSVRFMVDFSTWVALRDRR
jgi:hypothetical protein